MDDTSARLVRAMEEYFGADEKRIKHARKVTGYAEELLKHEGGDYTIVIAAGVLHDIGIVEAQRKYGKTQGHYQEIEGPPIARGILERLGFEPAQVDEICEIIAHHHTPGKIKTRNFAVLYDADWLVNLGADYDIHDKAKLARMIDRVFLTASGKARARQIYLGDSRSI